MNVKVNFAALKQTKWPEYVIRFVFGGLVTVATGIIAKRFGPGLGGLFLAFPAIFPASATLVEKYESEKKQRMGMEGSIRGRNAASLEARGAAMGATGLIAFAIIVWQAAHRNPGLICTSGSDTGMAIRVGRFLEVAQNYSWAFSRLRDPWSIMTMLACWERFLSSTLFAPSFVFRADLLTTFLVSFLCCASGFSWRRSLWTYRPLSRRPWLRCLA